MNFIKTSEADVVCLQEFNHSYNTEGNNISLFTKRFPYFFFSKDYQKHFIPINFQKQSLDI